MRGAGSGQRLLCCVFMGRTEGDLTYSMRAAVNMAHWNFSEKVGFNLTTKVGRRRDER